MIALTDQDVEEAEWHELERSCMKTANKWLMLGCLPDDAYKKHSRTSVELQEILRTYGKIANQRFCPRTKVFTRHFLVNYSNRDATEKAIKGLHNRDFHGRNINCSWLKCKWPIWGTTPRELGIVYGAGIQLYFNFMNTLIGATLVMFLMTFPLLFCNITGNALDEVKSATDSGFIISKLSLTTVCNLGTWRQYTSHSGDVYRKRVVEALGMVYDIRQVTLFGAFMDALACFCFWVVCIWYEFVGVPHAVEKARKKAVTPEVFSVHVTCLPKSLQNMTGKYEEKISMHFTRLLKGKIMTPSSARGMLVVTTTDAGSQDEKGWRWMCIPCGASGRDGRGRRLGRILEVNAPNRRCCVRWLKTRTSPMKEEWCSIDDLCDANLLQRLEEAGCDKESYRDGERLVHEVSIVRDYNGHLESIKQVNKKSEDEAERQLRKDVRKIEVTMTTETENAFRSIPVDKREVLAAFVIFSRMQHRNFLLHEYRFSRTWLRSVLLDRHLQFNGYKIKVSEATPPSDIFWENQDYPFGKQVRHKMSVFFVCLVAVMAVIGGCSLAKQAEADAKKMMQSDCEVGSANWESVECKCTRVGYVNVIHDQPEGIQEFCKEWLRIKARAAVISSGAAGSILVINCLAGILAVYLAKQQHPRSLTSFNISIFNISFVLQVLNLSIIAILVNSKFEIPLGLVGNGRFTELEPEWYIVVGGAIMMTNILNAVFPLVGAIQAPMYQLTKRFCLKRQKLLKSELLELYTPPEFPFAVLHSQLCCHVFTCLLFGSGMPIFWLLLPVNLFIEYWVDKYTLLRGSEMPPRYRGTVMLRMVQWMQVALVLHAGIAIWVFSNPESAPSYCSDCGNQEQYSLEDDDQLLQAIDDTSSLQNSLINVGGQHEEVDKVMRRTTYRSTMPPWLLLVFFLHYYFFRLVYYLFGQSIRSLFQYCRSSVLKDKQEYLEEKSCKMCNCRVVPAPIFYEPFAKKPLREMLRLKVICTYQLTKMPGYEFLAKNNRQGNRPSRGRANIGKGGASNSASSKPAGESKQAPRSNANFPAAEDQREAEYHSLIEARAENQAQLAQATRASANPERNRVSVEDIDDIYDGMILVCQREGSVYELGERELEIAGKVQLGEVIVAAGPTELEAGLVIIPIQPSGYVELAVVQNESGEVLCADDLDGLEAAPACATEYEGDVQLEEDEDGADWIPDNQIPEDDEGFISLDMNEAEARQIAAQKIQNAERGRKARLEVQQKRSDKGGNGKVVLKKQADGSFNYQPPSPRPSGSDEDPQGMGTASKAKSVTKGRSMHPVKVQKPGSSTAKAKMKAQQNSPRGNPAASTRSARKSKSGGKGRGKGVKGAGSDTSKAPDVNTYGAAREEDSD